MEVGWGGWGGWLIPCERRCSEVMMYSETETVCMKMWAVHVLYNGIGSVCILRILIHTNVYYTILLQHVIVRHMYDSDDL